VRDRERRSDASALGPNQALDALPMPALRLMLRALEPD
jgi:hypothetical protein